MAQKKITDLTLRSDFDATCNLPVDDTTQTYRVTGAQLNNFLKPNFNKNATLVKNVGLAVSAAAGAMTVALKQADGSTNPTSTDPLPTEIMFRSSTLTSGAKVLVSFTASLSIVIPSTATMGYANGENALIYVYAYYDGTNKGLMVTRRFLNEDALYSLAAIGAGSDDNGLYADASRSLAALRLIGKFQVDAITTAGTWTSPTSITVVPFSMPVVTESLSAKSADYTVTDTDGITTVLMTTSSSNKTVTLPTLADNLNRVITLKKADTGTGQAILDGEGSETIDTATTFILADQNDFVRVQAGSDSWKIIGSGIGASVQSRVKDEVGAGHGSGSTKIRRIETSVVNTGNAITKAYSSTLGNTYTINQNGIYHISYSDQYDGGTFTIGISKNSSQLTTVITSITNTDRLSASDGNTYSNQCTWVGRLAAGDVIRPHSDSNPNNTNIRCAFEIQKVGV